METINDKILNSEIGYIFDELIVNKLIQRHENTINEILLPKIENVKNEIETLVPKVNSLPSYLKGATVSALKDTVNNIMTIDNNVSDISEILKETEDNIQTIKTLSNSHNAIITKIITDIEKNDQEISIQMSDVKQSLCDINKNIVNYSQQNIGNFGTVCNGLKKVLDEIKLVSEKDDNLFIYLNEIKGDLIVLQEEFKDLSNVQKTYHQELVKYFQYYLIDGNSPILKNILALIEYEETKKKMKFDKKIQTLLIIQVVSLLLSGGGILVLFLFFIK